MADSNKQFVTGIYPVIGFNNAGLERSIIDLKLYLNK